MRNTMPSVPAPRSSDSARALRKDVAELVDDVCHLLSQLGLRTPLLALRKAEDGWTARDPKAIRQAVSLLTLEAGDTARNPDEIGPCRAALSTAKILLRLR